MYARYVLLSDWFFKGIILDWYRILDMSGCTEFFRVKRCKSETGRQKHTYTHKQTHTVAYRKYFYVSITVRVQRDQIREKGREREEVTVVTKIIRAASSDDRRSQPDHVSSSLLTC